MGWEELSEKNSKKGMRKHNELSTEVCHKQKSKLLPSKYLEFG